MKNRHEAHGGIRRQRAGQWDAAAPTSPAGAQRSEPGTPQPPATPLRLPRFRGFDRESRGGQGREQGGGGGAATEISAGRGAGGRAGRGLASDSSRSCHLEKVPVCALAGWTYFTCSEVLMSIEGNTFHHKTGLRRE